MKNIINRKNHQNSNFFWYRGVIPFSVKEVRGFKGILLGSDKLLKDNLNTGINTTITITISKGEGKVFG